MPSRNLSPSTVALVHHVELHSSGWWEAAIGRMILAVLRDAPEGPLTIDQIRRCMESAYGVRLLAASLQPCIDELLVSGAVVEHPSGFGLSNDTRRRCDEEVAQSRDVEKKARAVFMALVHEACPDCGGPELWLRFKEEFLVPMVRAEGAEVVRFASTGASEGVPNEILERFIDGIAPEDRDSLAGAIVGFLESHDVDVRDFVLENLDAHFVVVAAGLDRDALSHLLPGQGETLEMTIMLDTNYLFSALGLHDNPSNDAAKALLKLCEKADGAVDLKFGVLPVTVQETKQALSRKVEGLAAIRWSCSLATAAIKTGVPGFMQGYLEEVASKGGSMTFDEYASMLINDIVPRLKRLGIEVFDGDDEYGIRQDVIDDIMDQMKSQEALPADKRRSYEQFRHDMVLYHWVLDRRPGVNASTIQKKYWIGTLDGLFLAFDRRKTNRGRGGTAVCMHPSTLLQVLQFWAPRSEEFANALFGTVRLPLLGGRNRSATERVTLGIIQRLGELKEIESLSEESIIATLLDRAVNQQFRLAKTYEEELEAIELGIAKALKEREGQLALEQARAMQLEEAVSLRDEALAKRDAHLTGRAKQVEKLEERIDRVQSEKANLETNVAGLTDQVNILTDQLADSRQAQDANRWILTWVIGAGGVAGVVGVAATILSSRLLAIPWTKAAWVVAAILLVSWLRMAFHKGKQVSGISETTSFIALEKAVGGSWALFVVAAVAIFSDQIVKLYNGLWH